MKKDKEAIAEMLRTLPSGATRSPLGDKLQYSRFLDARVIKRWCEYLQAHRVQTNGEMREPDNYKKGIPQEVYLDSLWRHMMDIWLYQQGYESEMSESLEDSLCALLFNSHGLLLEVLRADDETR